MTAEVLRGWLDAHGVPFRLTEQELVDRFGMAYRLVRLRPDLPLFGMADRLTVSLVDPDLCPTEFVAGLRPTADAQENLKAAAQAIEAEFGPGEDASVSNTNARIWRFGRAFVQATVWPTYLNRHLGPNVLHASDPGAATECRLVIAPAWQPPFTRDALDQILGMRPLGWVPEIAPLQQPMMQDWPEDLGPFRGGIGPGPDGDLVIAARPGLCRILPRASLQRIVHHRAAPARGPGGAQVSVEFNGNRSLTLLRAVGDRREYLAEAEVLAASLSLPLSRTSAPDD